MPSIENQQEKNLNNQANTHWNACFQGKKSRSAVSFMVEYRGGRGFSVRGNAADHSRSISTPDPDARAATWLYR